MRSAKELVIKNKKNEKKIFTRYGYSKEAQMLQLKLTEKKH
jgi:hypothetical protein